MKPRARDIDALLRRRLALLERIEALGSISAAAKAVGITYKAAWDAVAALNAASDAPLVERSVGGAGGGGARLTRPGEALVAAYREVDAARRRELAKLSRGARALAPLVGWLRRLSIKTSARNQFFGRVSRVRRGTVSAEIVLTLEGGGALRAVVTRRSLAELGLREGVEAFALVKASWVSLAVGRRPAPGAGSAFRGVIEQLRLGRVDCEARVRLSGGAALAAVVARKTALALGLRRGGSVWAVVDPASVIVGVQA